MSTVTTVADLMVEVDRLRDELARQIAGREIEQTALRNALPILAAIGSVSTVADLRAAHLGQTITCHGWRGEFRSLALAHPGYIEVLIDAATVWVKLDQPCRIEARP